MTEPSASAWERPADLDWAQPAPPALSRLLTRGDAPDVTCAAGVYSILGPMYAGKSTHIIDVGAAYCRAGWGIVIARFKGDTRDGEQADHIETHAGDMSPGSTSAESPRRPAGVFNVRVASFAELAAEVRRIRTRVGASRRAVGRPTRWCILVDEGQFFGCGATGSPTYDMWSLAHDVQGHVWIACLNLDRELLPWSATRDLATQSVWCRLLYSTCAVPGCEAQAWCSHLVEPEADFSARRILIDSKDSATPMYEPRCTTHMPNLKNLWTPSRKPLATGYVVVQPVAGGEAPQRPAKRVCLAVLVCAACFVGLYMLLCCLDPTGVRR